MAEHAGSTAVLVDEIYGAFRAPAFFRILRSRAELIDTYFSGGNAGEIKMKLARGTPVGRAASIELRNQHMTYAVTW